MRLKRKDLIIITVLIAMCLVTLVGSSYALFTRTFTSTKKVSVQAGTLKVDFAEGNRINLSNVAPMSDSDGMNTTPYTFTITNSGSVAAYYTIRNEEDSSNTLNNKYIKYRLISDNYDSGIKTLDTIGSGYYMLSSENTLAVGKSITYKLYLWLSSEADNEAQNKTYQSKIVVQSTTNSISETVATTLLKGVGENGSIDASDPEQTFITGTDPNNYIWYSGKLWRAVSIDPSDNSVKLVTQWNMASIPFNTNGNGLFKESYMEQWLNDTSVDGFLGNLREPEKFIKANSVWNATATTETSKPEKATLVTDTVGLINLYEYTMSYNNISTTDGYLNNGLWWFLLNGLSSSEIYSVKFDDGSVGSIVDTGYSFGIRPAVNLKSNIKITSGIGTSDNPYRLEGDSDIVIEGTLLSTRYSGEYINFGIVNNKLYRIVSHENGNGTKIVSDLPLMNSSSEFLASPFDTTSLYYSADTTIGKFLNGTYLTADTYLSSTMIKLIDDGTWYSGTVFSGESYKFAKYGDINSKEVVSTNSTAKVGILRIGELMSNQTLPCYENVNYWFITRYSNTKLRRAGYNGDSYFDPPQSSFSFKPAMNLKSNVIITSGDGTKNNPFEVRLAE